MRLVAFLGLSALLLLAGYFYCVHIHAVSLTSLSPFVPYTIVAIIGAVSGFIDVGEGHQSSLRDLLQNFYVFAYMVINGVFAILAFYIILVFGWEFGIENGAEAVLIVKVLVAGVGTMIFFRSSFFTINVAGEKTPIGVNLLLEKLLKIVMQEVKQREARVVAKYVYEIVAGGEFDKLANSLPYICGAMLTIADNEQSSLMEDIHLLSSVDTIDNETKLMTLGLLLNKYYGKDILRSAKESWDGSINTES